MALKRRDKVHLEGRHSSEGIGLMKDGEDGKKTHAQRRNILIKTLRDARNIFLFHFPLT